MKMTTNDQNHHQRMIKIISTNDQNHTNQWSKSYQPMIKNHINQWSKIMIRIKFLRCGTSPSAALRIRVGSSPIPRSHQEGLDSRSSSEWCRKMVTDENYNGTVTWWTKLIQRGRPPWEFVKKNDPIVSLYKMAKHKLKLVQFLVWWLCAWRWKSWAGWKASGTSPERAFPAHSVRPLLWLHSHALGSKGDTNIHSQVFEAQNCLCIWIVHRTTF